jgi:hypothetical protein
MIIAYSDATDTAQTTPETLLPVPCPRCGTIDTPAVGPGSGPHHASARCRHCGGFVQWLSQYPPAERRARRRRYRLEVMAEKPPSQAQLTFLQALGDDGPPPANMAEASERIDTLKRGRVA